MSDVRKWLEENPERLFDRLVDNELSAAEQRELLAALEDEPGGWRRCALAFIEANVWRDGLNGMRGEQTVSLPNTDVTSQRRQSRWAYGFALAASVLVAFAGGHYLASAAAEGELAALRGRSTDRAVASVISTSNHAPNDDTQRDEVANPDSVDSANDSSGQAAPDWQTVQVNIADAVAGESADVEVPCLDVSDADPAQINRAWLAKQDSAVSAQMLQSLQETGHAVTTELQWWPIEMADGQRVVLPVEQVEVYYLGGEL